MNAYDAAHALARAIRESDSFRSMKSAKEALDPDPKAQQMLRDFHIQQLEFERKRMMGQEPTAEEQAGLQQLYEVLQLHPAVREYLMAEYQLGVMFQDVQKIIAEVFQEVSVEPMGQER